MSKVMGTFCQILAFLTMPAHQIWSCYLTQEANFKKFSLRPSSAFNIRKSHKISGRKAPATSNVISQKPRWGGGGVKTPPPQLLSGLIFGMRNHYIGNDSQLQMFTLYQMGFRSTLEIYPI